MMEEEYQEQKLSRYSARRRLQQNRMERQVRKSQRMIKRFRFFARYITIAFLIFLGYYLVKSHHWYLDKNVFNSISNPSLEILNNKIVPSYKILSALRRAEIPNKPMYIFETNEIKHNILQLEPVQNVFIRRFWFPARMQVIVQERVPSITISPAENVAPIAFFASDGKLIGRDYMPLNKSFKTILVLSYGVRGDDYRNWDESKIKMIEKLAKHAKASSGEEIEYIDFRTPNDVYIKLKTTKIRVGALDDTVFERLKRIPSILPQVKMLDKKIKYVDLRWKDANYIKLD